MTVDHGDTRRVTEPFVFEKAIETLVLDVGKA